MKPLPLRTTQINSPLSLRVCLFTLRTRHRTDAPAGVRGQVDDSDGHSPHWSRQPSRSWAADSTAGTATINTTDQPGLLTVTGLTVGQEATVTVTTTRDGYRDGSGDVTGTSLRAALTPHVRPVTRTAGGFTTPITNYDGDDYNPSDYNWTPDTTAGTAEIDPTGPTSARLVVTGLDDGQEATASVTTTRNGYFDGDDTVTGSALETELTPTFGEPVAGSRSFTAQITNYDPQFDWTAESDQGTAIVDDDVDPVVVRVSGLDPLQEATVEVTATRDGYKSGTASVQGAADIGGRLDPEFGTAVPTSDGFTAPITNFDAAFTFTAVSTQGQARVSGAGQVVVTGVAPDTDVSVTVTSTRNRYDSGTGTTQSRSLKAALEPELQNGTRLAGGYSTEVSRYSSRYTWIVSTGVGSATINDRGEIKVSGLNPGQATTLTVRTMRDGYGEGRTTVEARALEAALTPALSAITRTPTGFQAQITNFDGAFTWSATAAAGSVSVSGSGLVTVTGLPAGAGSKATVTASRTGYETGSSSITGQALTTAPSASVPAAPTIKSIKAKKRGKAKIAWLATGTARPPITSAVATCKAGKSKASVTGTTSTLTIKGLRKGKKYSCTVQVKNISGTSAKSAPVKIKAK